MIQRAKKWARGLKRDIVALYMAARDPRVPWFAKAVAAVVAAYALSPIDLIPDFVPILGYVDDLVILPAGILVATSLVPRPVMGDLRAWAVSHRCPASTAGLTIVLLLWLAGAALTAHYLWLLT